MRHHTKPAELNRVFYFALMCSHRGEDKTQHDKKCLEYLHIEYRIFAYRIYIKHDAYFPGGQARANNILSASSVPGAFHTAPALQQPKDPSPVPSSLRHWAPEQWLAQSYMVPSASLSLHNIFPSCNFRGWATTGCSNVGKVELNPKLLPLVLCKVQILDEVSSKIHFTFKSKIWVTYLNNIYSEAQHTQEIFLEKHVPWSNTFVNFY